MNGVQDLTRMQSKAKQSGFTIIELVVVILLLGILAATALPRFMDVTDEAHSAVVNGVAGGLATGTGLFHAQWVGNGQPGTAGSNLSNFGSGNAKHGSEGYPAGGSTTGLPSVGECDTLFTDLLQGGRPSTLQVAGSVATTLTLGGSDYTEDFAVSVSGAACYFIYTAAGTAVSSPYITLNITDGDITFDPVNDIISPQ